MQVIRHDNKCKGVGPLETVRLSDFVNYNLPQGLDGKNRFARLAGCGDQVGAAVCGESSTPQVCAVRSCLLHCAMVAMPGFDAERQLLAIRR